MSSESDLEPSEAEASESDDVASEAPVGVSAILSRLNRPESDGYLTIAAWLLVIAVLALAVLFGWSLWTDWQTERGATPASRALLDLEKVVRQDPQNANLRVRYGEALGGAGLLDQATEQFLAALELNPEHSGAMLDVGIIAMQQQDYRRAEEYFQGVLELTEGQEFEFLSDRKELALFYLGEIALTEKRYEDAIPFFKAALRIRRDAADTYLELALAYRGTNSVEQAKKQLEIALAFDPALGQANFEMGQILLEEGNELEAAVYLGRAYAQSPDNQQAAEAVELLGPVGRRITAAREALKAADLETAVTEAKIAFALDPRNFEAAVVLGQVLEADGQTKEAIKAFEDADSIKHDDPEVIAALERLRSL